MELFENWVPPNTHWFAIIVPSNISINWRYPFFQAYPKEPIYHIQKLILYAIEYTTIYHPKYIFKYIFCHKSFLHNARKGAWGVSSDHENVVQNPGFVASARDLGQTLGAAGFWVGWVGCFLDIFGGLDTLW